MIGDDLWAVGAPHMLHTSQRASPVVALRLMERVTRRLYPGLKAVLRHEVDKVTLWV